MRKIVFSPPLSPLRLWASLLAAKPTTTESEEAVDAMAADAEANADAAAEGAEAAADAAAEGAEEAADAAAEGAEDCCRRCR